MPHLPSPPTRALRAGPGKVVSSGQLARVYGFTDTDGTQPDCGRYVVGVQGWWPPAADTGYRSARRALSASGICDAPFKVAPATSKVAPFF